MKKLSQNVFADLLKLFGNPDAVIPYELYSQTPAPLLIAVARCRHKFAPGDGARPVLTYTCKIAVPYGFITTENPAPVILAAIGKIIGNSTLAEALSEKYQLPQGWAESLVQWRELLRREVDRTDLKILLQDLGRSRGWGLSSTIEEYCQRKGLLSKP